jgi:small-conductance mechanosensitive channel
VTFLAGGVLAVAIRILIVVVAAAVVLDLVHRVLRRVEGADHHRGGSPGRRTTLYRLLSSAASYVVAFLALVTILDYLGVPTTSLLAGAGVAGLAVAFGAQEFVQDVVTGLSIMYEDEYQVGESVAFPSLGISGTVQEVGIRITRLAAAGGEAITLPNRLVTEVTNYSRRPSAVSVSVAVPVAATNDPVRVREALTEAAERSSAPGRTVSVVGVTALAPGVATWTLTATVDNGQQAPFASQLSEAAWKECHSRGIAMAPAVLP